MSSRGKIVVNLQNRLSHGEALMCGILQRRVRNVSRFEKAECCSTVAALCRARPRCLCEREGYGENKGVGREEKPAQAEEETFACLMGEE